MTNYAIRPVALHKGKKGTVNTIVGSQCNYSFKYIINQGAPCMNLYTVVREIELNV